MTHGMDQAGMKVAVIGAGRIAAEHLSALAGRRDVRVAAVCDLSPALARWTAERFGVEAAHTDHRRMLDEVRPDAAHVLTPPHTHAAIVSDCLEAGAHVIVEKPAAPTLAELERLRSLAEARDRWLIEDQNYRFNEPVRRLRGFVESGRLGAVRDVEVWLSLDIRSASSRYADANLPHPSHHLPAGVVHEFLPHLCYLSAMFLPSVDRVSATWSNHGEDSGGDGLFKYDDLDAVVIGGDAHARLRFSCGTRPEKMTLTVRGERAWAEADLFNPCVRVVGPRPGPAALEGVLNQAAGGARLTLASAGNFWAKLMGASAYEGLGEFLRLTYDALRDGGEPPVTAEQSELSARMIEALLAERNRFSNA